MKEQFVKLMKANGFTRDDSLLAYRAFADATAMCLDNIGQARITGVGVLTKIDVESRMVRNPMTGAQCLSKPKTKIKFKAGKALIDAVK